MCEKIVKLGNLYNLGGRIGGSFAGTVFGVNGVSPALLNLGSGGNRQPMIVVGSTQAHAYMDETDVSPTLTEAMGQGGGTNSDDSNCRYASSLIHG